MSPTRGKLNRGAGRRRGPALLAVTGTAAGTEQSGSLDGFGKKEPWAGGSTPARRADRTH